MARRKRVTTLELFARARVRSTFRQGMATDVLRKLTEDVTPSDMFLYSCAPPDVWAPYGVHHQTVGGGFRRLLGFW